MGFTSYRVDTICDRQTGCRPGKNNMSPDPEGGDIITLKAGHHWPASKTPLKLCFTEGPMMAQHWMLAW